MAGWCNKDVLKGFSQFLYGYFKEETIYFEKFRYFFINKVDVQGIIIEMKAPQSSFKSVEDLFKAILKHEEYITSCTNELFVKAM